MSSRTYPHLADRLLNTPLLLHPQKLDAIIAGLGGRLLGVDGLQIDAATLTARAALPAEMFTTRRGERTERGYRVVDGRMSTNLYKRLKALLPEAPVLTGTVTVLYADGTAEVTQDGGHGLLRARNPLLLASGTRAYVKGGAITVPAPDLPYVLIEV